MMAVLVEDVAMDAHHGESINLGMYIQVARLPQPHAYHMLKKQLLKTPIHIDIDTVSECIAMLENNI